MKITFNILTRTSSRPLAILNCHKSVSKQVHCNVNHLITNENDSDLTLITSRLVKSFKVKHLPILPKRNENNRIHAPYNLHCNRLLEEVDNGWIMFLDDDDHLLHDHVLSDLRKSIQNIDEDTLLIFKMRYPNGSVKPPLKFFQEKAIKINEIGSCCFMFHSKYKDSVKWDEWKGADFRFLRELASMIPKQKWINRVFVQINNQGDFGQQNDIEISYDSIIFKKKWYWRLIPKYHWTIIGYPVFNKVIFEKVKRKFFSK